MRLARAARRRHGVVLGFLLSIGVPPRQAEIDAEGIEHHVSVATIRALRRLGLKATRAMEPPGATGRRRTKG